MTVAMLSRAIRAANPDVLHAIREDDVSIAIWKREPLSDIRGIRLTDLRNLRFDISRGERTYQVERELASAGIRKGIRRNALAADMMLLANQFATVMGLDEVEIRLEHVTTNACKKFHGDYVTARLICTYFGPGTQWLDGKGAEDCGCGDAHDILQMNAGDVALLKGRLWSDDHPAIHRSPPIEGSGEDRLVLVINPASTPE